MNERAPNRIDKIVILSIVGEAEASLRSQESARGSDKPSDPWACARGAQSGPDPTGPRRS